MTPNQLQGNQALVEVLNALDSLERLATMDSGLDSASVVGHVIELRRCIIASMSPSQKSGLYTAAHFASVLDTVVDGIVIVDASGTIELFNQAAEAMFGYSASEAIRQNVSLLTPFSSGEHDEYMSKYLRTGQATVIGIGRKVEARHKDGSLVPVHLSLSKVEVAGRVTFTGIIRSLAVEEQVGQSMPSSAEREV